MIITGKVDATREDVPDFVGRVGAALGLIDILVTSAGIKHPQADDRTATG